MCVHAQDVEMHPHTPSTDDLGDEREARREREMGGDGGTVRREGDGAGADEGRAPIVSSARLPIVSKPFVYKIFAASERDRCICTVCVCRFFSPPPPPPLLLRLGSGVRF